MLRKSCFSLILLLVLAITYCLPLSAGEKVRNYRFPESVNIQGIFGGYSLPFEVDKNWLLKDNCFLQVNFHQSNIQQDKYSTLTFYLNDFPIQTILLSNYRPENNQIKVRLPQDKLYQGFNLLRLKIYHRATNEKCSTDDINNSAWLVLDKSSYLHLEYQNQEENLSLRNYPYPFLEKYLSQPLKAKIVVPDNPSDQEITAAILLAADFGRRVPLKDISVSITKYGELTEDEKREHLIFIGASSYLPKELNLRELETLGERVLLKLVKSPYAWDKEMLIITAKDGKKLLDGVRVLGQDALIYQMGKSSALIGKYPKIEEKTTIKEKNTLADLGYGDTLLKGLFYQEAVYNMALPKDRKIAGEGLIKLKFRYSRAINFAKSSLTVYLNGKPVKSQKLNSANADNDTMIIPIPDEEKQSNYFEVKMVFYLEPGKMDCKIREEDNVWAFVSKTSYFDLPSKAIAESYLEDYPSPFVQNQGFNSLSLVLPDSPDSNILTIAANMAAFLGHHVNSLDNFKVVRSKNLTDLDRNLIVLGTPQNNNLIEKLNPYLHIQFAAGCKSLLSNGKIALLDDYGKNAVSIQIIQSPWAKKRKILLFSSANNQILSLSQLFLSRLDYVNKLKGDGMVVDQDGNFQSAGFVQSSLPASQSSFWQKMLSSEASTKKNLLIIAVALAGGLMVLGILLILLKRK